LAALSGKPVTGVRQHFLKMRPGRTQDVMHAAGLEYDATFGFPDRNGFRLGTASIIPPWDERNQRPIAMDEVPLIWMDRGLSKYQNIEDPERWVDDAIQLATACRAVNGLWVGLWHPSMVAALGFPGAPAAFGRLLGALKAEQPYNDTVA